MTMRISKNRIDLDDKILRKPVLEDYGETLVGGASGTNTGSSYTVDLTTGNVFNLILSANCTFTFSNPPASGTLGHFTLILLQDGTGSRTATWPSAVVWPASTAPTLTTTANHSDVLHFSTYDGGSTWFGIAVSQNFIPPVFFYEDLGEDHAQTGGSTYTFTGFNIGSDDEQDRVVYILYASEETGTRSLSSATIDGVSKTDVIAQATFDTATHYGIMKATIPSGSGTTGSVVFNWSGTMTRMQMYGYAAYNPTNQDSGSGTGTNPSFTMDVWEGGVSAVMLACQNDETVTWGGDLVEQFNSSWTANSEFAIGAEEGVGTTSSGKTHSVTASDSGSVLYGVSFS